MVAHESWGLVARFESDIFHHTVPSPNWLEHPPHKGTVFGSSPNGTTNADENRRSSLFLLWNGKPLCLTAGRFIKSTGNTMWITTGKEYIWQE